MIDGEVAVGTRLPEWRPGLVSAERMKTMAALLRDPNPIHFDPEVCRELGIGDRVVNQGPLNLSYVHNLLLAWTGDAAAVRRLTVRFAGRVLAGDVLVATGVVTRIAAEGDLRVAGCAVELRSEDTGAVLVTGTAEVLLPG
ncbi:protein dehydratase [Nakamurella sp. YIM 132087]|uniref:Protein dehydratase n=1 Tax=Nakamurella alba TaxID=2665158 RepID=A0A7K1FKL9_9ACTN|nr:MaoC family dehydratase [Nakamurella alba]MTD13414.1 protein dehydratase [Nakamurella alba]